MNRCIRCGERLTSTKSGLGPRCKTRILERARSLTGFKPDQIDKALELIEMQAIVSLRKRRVWLSMASKGDRVYKTAAQACTCEGGVYHGRCYHQAAALLLQ